MFSTYLPHIVNHHRTFSLPLGKSSDRAFWRGNRPRRYREGFTLVELLAVTSIVILLMALASNMARVDTRRADVNAALYDFDGMLRSARLEARSKATYVWVGMKALGNEGMQVAVFASKDGSANSVATNLVQVGQIRTLHRVSAPGAGHATPTRLLADYQASSVGPTSTERLGGSTLTLGTAPQIFADAIVCFNPHGVASIPGRTTSGFIEVLFAPVAGSSDGDVKSSSVLLSRSTGVTQIYR
jgi:Tfp pilus assembly protein FimT